MRALVKHVVFALAVLLAAQAQGEDRAPRPKVWMYPPARREGACFRELFEHPDQWKETRAAVDVLGYADHNLDRQFSDDQLRAWLPRLRAWGMKLELEVGAVKPWGTTGRRTFEVQRPMWDRVQRLGGSIYAIAMDEPLSAARHEIHQPDDYAVEETADFIARVREHYPQVLIGDIEPYPSVPLADLVRWIESLEKRLAARRVRGLDFYRLDVDWVVLTVANRGSWQEVKTLERDCRRRGLPFSLIYWAADYPAMQRRGLADDATWYVSTLQQGYDYALVDGAPDQYVIESWVDGPPHALPETDQFSFTRSVLDFSRKFVPRRQEKGPP
jgi:hypothetical protein